MAKIKHPGVLRLLEPLEETTTQLMFITEPVLGTLGNVTARFRDVPGASEASRALELSHLEIK
jgi:SCY1-like protein 2